MARPSAATGTATTTGTARVPLPHGPRADAAPAWLRLPAASLRAGSGRTPERPWIVPAAVGWLGRRMRRTGACSSWDRDARRSGSPSAPASVLAFEDNEYWRERARRADSRRPGAANVEIRELPVERFAAESKRSPDERLRPGGGRLPRIAEAERVDAVRAGRDKVRPGGYLLLDDSDRPGYAEALELLEGWRQRRFAGVKDGWPEAARPRSSGDRAEGRPFRSSPNRRGPLAGPSSVASL